MNKTIIKKQEEKKLMKSNKGITLIALVVTIVVLLILAGVSINVLFGESGLITKAKEAEKAYRNGEQDDLESMKNIENWLNKEITEITTP